METSENPRGAGKPKRRLAVARTSSKSAGWLNGVRPRRGSTAMLLARDRDRDETASGIEIEIETEVKIDIEFRPSSAEAKLLVRWHRR